MTTLLSILCLILALLPVVVLLCQPANGIGTGQPDPRSWPEIAATAILRLVIAAGMIYAAIWIVENW